VERQLLEALICKSNLILHRPISGQLANAVGYLRRFEEGEAAVIRRLEDRYRAKEMQLDAEIDGRRQRLKQQAKSALTDSERYAFIRQHIVQVWKLGVGATGMQLDHAIDALMRKTGSNPIADYQTEDNVMPLRPPLAGKPRF
jgi:hypothetical protein